MSNLKVPPRAGLATPEERARRVSAPQELAIDTQSLYENSGSGHERLEERDRAVVLRLAAGQRRVPGVVAPPI